jgi:uncharacterized membrane protein
MLGEFAAVMSVFGVAFFSLWGSVPAGLALNLSPVVIAITAAISYAASVALVTLAGTRVRDWMIQRFRLENKLTPNPDSRVYRVWERYGIIGLGMIAPLTVGGEVGALIAVGLHASPRKTFVWMSIGGAVWAVIFTALFVLGIATVQSVT